MVEHPALNRQVGGPNPPGITKIWYDDIHMDNTQPSQMDRMEKNLEEIYKTNKSIKMYFKLTFIVTVIFFVLPLIASLVMIPWFISQYSSLYSGLY